MRNLEHLKRQMAERLIAMHPEETYTHKAGFEVLAAPVYLVELKADGHIRSIQVLRRPSVADDTVQLGMDAIRRAAPYGNVTGMRPPWAFTETFLFDERRRFKPRSLD